MRLNCRSWRHGCRSWRLSCRSWRRAQSRPARVATAKGPMSEWRLPARAALPTTALEMARFACPGKGCRRIHASKILAAASLVPMPSPTSQCISHGRSPEGDTCRKASHTGPASSASVLCKLVASTFALLSASGCSSLSQRTGSWPGPCNVTTCCCALLDLLRDGAFPGASVEARSRSEASSWMCNTATHLGPGALAAEASAMAADAGAAAADPGALAADPGLEYAD